MIDADERGWLRIVDPLLDGDRRAQSTLAGDISDRLGAIVVALAVEFDAVVRYRLYERGLLIDEYLSVPTFYDDLPDGRSARASCKPDSRLSPDRSR